MKPHLIRYYILILLLVFSTASVWSETPVIRFSPEAEHAYKLIFQLRLREAGRAIDEIKHSDPDNYVVYFLENYIDFFTLFIGENAADLKRLRNNKDVRLNKINKTDISSPYYLYCRAEINLQWALARLKFEEYTRAFFEVRSAFQDLQTNIRRFPSFAANKKSMGVLHAAIGTIPDEYRWGVSWIGGMDGTIDQGVRELEEVINYGRRNKFLFKDEAVVMYAFVMLHLNNDPDRAWKIISESGIDPGDSPLGCFAMSNIAIRTGRNDLAISYLTNRPSGPRYLPFYYLDFMLGSAKLHRLDRDANIYLEVYTKNFKGRNYIKEAYQKLAWYDLVHGNTGGYRDKMIKVLKYGQDQLDEDKTALREAKTKVVPNALLLRARLLYDGGYLTRAAKILNSANEAQFVNDNERLEFNYRRGRLAQSMGNDEEALRFYSITISKGRNLPAYFACNAALNTGIIYEGQRRFDLARKNYNLCLSMSPSEYKASLHQKAKAGLNRL
ncbi:MAG TPA: hypothetical protein PLR24_07710 [Saprospiraceae bacterium]|nr:hypothetical protein [Saprospiraceae bacterium]